MIIDKVSIAPFKTGMNEILISYHHTKRAEVDELLAKLLRKRFIEVATDSRPYRSVEGDEFVVLDERAKHGVETICKRIFIVPFQPRDVQIGECVLWHGDIAEGGFVDSQFEEQQAMFTPNSALSFYRRIA